MDDSSTPSAALPATLAKRKREKPTFPLFKHKGSGFWCKKVKGKSEYFGKVADDPEGTKALELWNLYKDDLLAGRGRREKVDEPTIKELCNRFLHHKKSLLDSGELAQRTYDQYFGNCQLVADTFGRGRTAGGITPDEFQKLRNVMAKKWGPVRLGNQIQSTRSLFKFGWESGILTTPVRFGPGFKKPSAKTLRVQRTAKGPKLLEAEQVRDLLKWSPVWFQAMILLGVQAGFGNTDVAELPESAVNLTAGWIEYPRAKTGMPRRVPLWPETVAALRATIAAKPTPKNPDDTRLVFIGARGQNYIGNHKGYRVTAAFDSAAKDACVDGRTFYDLRRTFQTIGEGAHDLVAVQAIMGHAPASGDMSAVYRQRVDDARLKAVTDHVHAWLYPPEKPDPKPAKKKAVKKAAKTK